MLITFSGSEWCMPTAEILKVISVHVNISWIRLLFKSKLKITILSLNVLFTIWWVWPLSFQSTMDKLKYSMGWPGHRNGGDHIKLMCVLLFSTDTGLSDNGESASQKDWVINKIILFQVAWILSKLSIQYWKINVRC